MHEARNMTYLWILVAFLAVVITAAAIIRHIEARSIFFPMKGRPALVEPPVSHEEVFFDRSDGLKLHGRFIPNLTPPGSAGKRQTSSNALESASVENEDRASSVSLSAPTVLFLHGNAGNIGHRWDKVRVLRDSGASVFIFDYRGYGLSDGSPSEKGIYRDVEAACAYLAGRGIELTTVIVYGESIGGGFAVDLASKQKVAGLIVESSFTSITAMVRRSVPFIPTVLLATKLDSLSKIGKVTAPKLIFHSVDDEIVPYQMGEELFGAATEPKYFVPLHGGHNTAYLEDLPKYRSALARFILNVSMTITHPDEMVD